MDEIPTVSILLLGDSDCGKSAFLSYVLSFHFALHSSNCTYSESSAMVPIPYEKRLLGFHPSVT